MTDQAVLRLLSETTLEMEEKLRGDQRQNIKLSIRTKLRQLMTDKGTEWNTAVVRD